jgi:hypothetical protein
MLSGRTGLAKITSCAIIGQEGAIVDVAVDISPGLPSFTSVRTTNRYLGQGSSPFSGIDKYYINRYRIEALIGETGQT